MRNKSTQYRQPLGTNLSLSIRYDTMYILELESPTGGTSVEVRDRSFVHHYNIRQNMDPKLQ